MVVKRAGHPKDDLFLTLGLGYLGQFLGQRLGELVLANGKRKGFVRMRTSHGFVIQHLVETDQPISRTGSEIARRMGVSQQAASKTIAELSRLGVVEVNPSIDRRAKHVSLSPRGWEAVQQARRYRVDLEERLKRNIGPKRYIETQKALRDCLISLGGVERIGSRRIRQPE